MKLSVAGFFIEKIALFGYFMVNYNENIALFGRVAHAQREKIASIVDVTPVNTRKVEAHKDGMEFWAFDAGDPALSHFCSAYADRDFLYCIVYIEECLQNYSDELRELLHLHNNALLLIDHALLPLYAHLRLKGCFFLLSEEFCATDQTKVLLQFCFYHKTLECVTDSITLNDDQKVCITCMLQEYHRPYDNLQPHILRNLLRNLLLLSSEAQIYTMHLKAGHLLFYAKEFMNLLKENAFLKKKKSFYAETLGITDVVLSQVLQNVFQKTFREIIVHHTITKAMKLLVFSDQNMVQIARRFNYDTSDFGRLFFKEKGIYPIELRQRYREILNQI